ncbi:Sedlin [Xylona heveae TC161]|uniref:Trafficking protein particle complex subunit 2-like protein n=1 Tax=Xylona heveae (strain CBS 132557 / TC161) TaxID=1328760 RepID=A0A165J042_XYLHT|nr:Sedlin [Xylona heveae TC161]KZF25606.1 Sedlin [Xylona heveae TC161]
MATPSIACIGIIGKHNNPLHISLFPPHSKDRLKFSFLLSSCIDIFEIRALNKTVDQDLGLLQAVDERLAMYGWLTNTGIKFIIVVDMEGRPVPGEISSGTAVTGLRGADLKPAFRAIQTAYIRLLQNPFYSPDDHTPLEIANNPLLKSSQITSKRFIDDMRRIGDAWAPGVTNI